MSVSSLSENRNFDRVLEFTRDKVLDGVFDQAFNHSPLAGLLLGRLLQTMFGELAMGGRSRRIQGGGESIRTRMNLGKNTTAKTQSGPWDTVNASPSDTVRHTRKNWKFYSSTIVLSEHDLGVNRGPEALSSLMQFESENAVNSLVDLVVDHAYDSSAVSTRVDGLEQIISAGDSVGGLSGLTYTDWNSRGVSDRGTAPASVSFAGTGFAADGLQDWQLAYNNASEGSIRPQVVMTEWNIYNLYEGQLQAQERFQNTSVADAGFQNLMFKGAPVMPDSKCPATNTYFLNADKEFMQVLEGFDFSVGPFERSETQTARVSKVLFTGNQMSTGRKYQNKVTGVSS